MDVRFAEGVASLHFVDLPVVDYVTIPNSISRGALISGTPLAARMTLDIEWSGRKRDLGIFESQLLGLTDHLIEVETVTVAASVTEPKSAPGSSVGFTFNTNPTSFVNTFSAIGTERNGRFSPSPHG